MKKFTFSAILLIIIIFQASGQKVKDAVYLKNGSIIYGSLIEISNNQYKIKGSDGSIFIYASDEVDHFAKETPQFAGRKKSGMTFGLEAGFLAGAQSNSYKAPFSFDVVAGYTIEKKSMLGIGTGAEFLEKTFVPLFLEYRYTMRDRKVSPFFFFRSGLLMYLGSDDETEYPYYPQYYQRKEYAGGASLNVGTGLSWAGEDVETYLSFSYRYAQTSYLQTEYNQTDVTYKTNYNRLEVKVGFRF
jgi:hypothetical protein